jgi:hypothetical protein
MLKWKERTPDLDDFPAAPSLEDNNGGNFLAGRIKMMKRVSLIRVFDVLATDELHLRLDTPGQYEIDHDLQEQHYKATRFSINHK